MIFNERYVTKDMKGQGSYGTVFEVTDKTNNESYALKLIKIKNNEAEKLKNEYKREIEVMKNIKNKYIIKLIDNFYDEKRKGFCIVMELCDGNLKDLFENENYKNGLPLDVINKIFIQLNEALDTMRDCGFIHRDLKTENILIKYTDESKTNFDIKLTDFGLATNEINSSIHTFSVAGTINYMAPEVETRHYNDKCDLWSLGVILYELCTNKYIFDIFDSKNKDEIDNKKEIL